MFSAQAVSNRPVCCDISDVEEKRAVEATKLNGREYCVVSQKDLLEMQSVQYIHHSWIRNSSQASINASQARSTALRQSWKATKNSHKGQTGTLAFLTHSQVNAANHFTSHPAFYRQPVATAGNTQEHKPELMTVDKEKYCSEIQKHKSHFKESYYAFPHTHCYKRITLATVTDNPAWIEHWPSKVSTAAPDKPKLSDECVDAVYEFPDEFLEREHAPSIIKSKALASRLKRLFHEKIISNKEQVHLAGSVESGIQTMLANYIYVDSFNYKIKIGKTFRELNEPEREQFFICKMNDDEYRTKAWNIISDKLAEKIMQKRCNPWSKEFIEEISLDLLGVESDALGDNQTNTLFSLMEYPLDLIGITAHIGDRAKRSSRNTLEGEYLVHKLGRSPQVQVLIGMTTSSNFKCAKVALKEKLELSSTKSYCDDFDEELKELKKHNANSQGETDLELFSKRLAKGFAACVDRTMNDHNLNVLVDNEQLPTDDQLGLLVSKYFPSLHKESSDLELESVEFPQPTKADKVLAAKKLADKKNVFDRRKLFMRELFKVAYNSVAPKR